MRTAELHGPAEPEHDDDRGLRADDRRGDHHDDDDHHHDRGDDHDVAGRDGLYSPTPVDGWGILKEGVGDQYVDAVEIAGNAVYVGGIFTHAVKGTTTADRANVMSVDLSTGNLRSFVADTNGSVNALASDGDVALPRWDLHDGERHAPQPLAKINLTTGAVDPTFIPTWAALVDDMVVVGGTALPRR